MSAGLGLAGLGAAAVAEAQPAPFALRSRITTGAPDRPWDPGWGNNWDRGRCHDDHWYDGDPHDQGHWHG